MKKTKKAFLSSQQAFTLIELMVAIAIIGILAGVVIVSVSGSRDKAKSTAALKVLQSIMPAAIECNMRGQTLGGWGSATEGGNYICNGSGFSWPTLNTPSTSGWSWWGSDWSTYYYAYNSSTATHVLCPITYTGWKDWGGANSVLPGTCVVRQ